MNKEVLILGYVR